MTPQEEKDHYYKNSKSFAISLA